MPRFRQPPRTIPGATITADRITFPLDDPNDPRYKAYQDSLLLYNRSEDLWKYVEATRTKSFEESMQVKRALQAKYPADYRYNKTIQPIYHKSIDNRQTGSVDANFDDIAFPVYKKPTAPVETKHLQPLNADPMVPKPATGVAMRQYPYEHTSKNWGKHWQSTSGQSAPKGGGSYFLNRRSDGSNDLLTPEEHENVLRTTQQRPTIRFRNGGVVPEQQQTFVDPGMAAMSKVVTMRNQNLNWVQRGLNPDLSPKINNPDGSLSTHELAWGSGENGSAFVYPTIIQGNNGGLQRLSGEDAWNHAVENRTAIRFKSPKLAEFYSKQGLIQHPLKFRNGGVVPTPREAYENSNVYAYRPQEDTYYSNLPGVDVVAKDTRVADAVRGGQNRFLRGVADLMGQPQQQMMGAITGTRQTPSQAWGFKDPRNFAQKAANFAIDVLVDPINLVPGVGLYNLSKSTGRNATKALFRPLRKAGDNVAEMGRRQLKNNIVNPVLNPLNDAFGDIEIKNVLEKIRGSQINTPVYKTIDREIKKQLSPENFRRAANWDKEFGSELVQNLTQLKNMNENAIINKYQIPFSLDNNLKGHIGKTEINPGGLSRLNEAAVIEARLMDSGMMPQRKFTFKDTEMVLSTNQIKDAKKARRTIQHEMRHGLDVHGRYFSPEENEMFTRIMRNDDDVDVFIEEVVRKNPNMSLDEITELRESSDYFRHNTEIASYGVTNARQALLDVGIIRKIDQTVTPQDLEKLLFLANKHPEKIENVVSPEFLRFVDPKKTKEWAELMNKSILGLTGVAALGKRNFKQQTQ